MTDESIKSVCTRCDAIWKMHAPTVSDALPPSCVSCGGKMIWFNESGTTFSTSKTERRSKYGRKCAVCGGPLGPQCFGGVWTNDWCDFIEGKITAADIRESCAMCLSGPPSYMWGKDVHDTIIERRWNWCAKQIRK